MAECFWTDLVGVTQGLCGEDAGGDLFAIAYYDMWHGPPKRGMYVVNKNDVPVDIDERDSVSAYAVPLTRAKVTATEFYEFLPPDYSCGLQVYDIHGEVHSIFDDYYMYMNTRPDLTSIALASPATTTGLDIDLIYTLDEWGDGHVWALLDSDFTPGYGLTKLTVDTDIGVFDWWIMVDNCF